MKRRSREIEGGDEKKKKWRTHCSIDDTLMKRQNIRN